MNHAAGRVDLHLHTTASDGTHTPSQIVQMAQALGLRAIAITDHDCMAGVREATAAAAGSALLVIPGVELSTDVPEGEVHVLGYYLDDANPELQTLLAKLRGARLQRARRMVEKLAALGLPLSWDRVQAIANGAAVGRPHVARALLEAGHVSSVQDAFSLYIGRHGPAYVERYRLTPAEAVALVRRLGGLPVLAHPSFVPNLPERLPQLVAAGLTGMEVWYTGYSPDTTSELSALARQYGLVETGGSDFHGVSVMPSAILGAVPVPYAAVEELERRRALTKR